MRKPSKKIWFLFLVLFLLVSIFPPWDHPRIGGIKFSPLYDPPGFVDTIQKYTFNDMTYTPVYEGRLAWKLLFFEYFILVISFISLWMIEDNHQKVRSRSVLTKKQKLITVIAIMVIATSMVVIAIEKFYLQPKRYETLYDKLEKSGYFENNTPQRITEHKDLLSRLISTLFGSSKYNSYEVGRKLFWADLNGYNAEQILAAFCKAYPATANADVFQEYKNVETTLTLDEMAARKKLDFIPTTQGDPNELLSQIISYCLNEYSKAQEPLWKRMSVELRYARDNGYSAENILGTFCKAHPRFVEFCPEYINVETTLTLFDMAAFSVNDPNKSGIAFVPVEYDPNK